MSFLKKIFGGISSGESNFDADEPDIKFGRYSDAFKNDQQVNKWRSSDALFKEKKYIEAYNDFFHYLKDEKAENVKHTVDGDKIDFEILQGSKKVVGTASTEKVHAEVRVVKCNKLGVAFMRKLMEKNYSLRYSRFALDGDLIYMKFTTTTEDGSPEKLYYALKEIAIQSDKQDDLLVEEFSAIEPIDNGHIIPLTDGELQTKINWLRKYIDGAISDIEDNPQNKNDSDKAYSLLSLVFKLDYLISPEGKVMDLLEKAQSDYYRKNDNKNIQDKVAELIKKFKKIRELTDDQLKNELYRTTATFGLGSPTGHGVVADMIENIGKNVNAALEAKRNKPARAMEEYILGYSLFFYGLLKPTRRHYEFMLKLLNYDYFKELGFKRNYVENGKPNKSEISRKINAINQNFKEEYPNISVNSGSLKYHDMEHFIFSYLQAIQKLPYTEA